MTGLRRFVKRPPGPPAQRTGGPPGSRSPGAHAPTAAAPPAALEADRTGQDQTSKDQTSRDRTGRDRTGRDHGGQPAAGTAEQAATGTAEQAATGTAEQAATGSQGVFASQGGLPGLPVQPRTAGYREAGAEAPADVEYCQLCREILDSRHGHLVDTEKRSLACACRPCYLLFTHQGAGGGRYRAVPDRIWHDPSRPLTDADWNELQIPVAMAFFFFNSALSRVVAGYPSPGGPTECELDLAAWDRLAAAHPLLGEMAPDVEAIFVNRTELGNEVFLIPIDMCYSLVGELRLRWQGFDGGSEVRASIATFLTGVRNRAVPLPRQLADQHLEH